MPFPERKRLHREQNLERCELKVQGGLIACEELGEVLGQGGEGVQRLVRPLDLVEGVNCLETWQV